QILFASVSYYARSCGFEDYFISLHSNAHRNGSTVNYLVLLFRGETGKPYQEHSDEMARVAYSYIWDNPLTCWSHYTPENPLVVGDITFMGGTPPGTPNRIGVNGYYAVLKHRVPGFLVEGSFHTYDPERQRLLNRDYCRMEGVRYYRGIREYFGGKPEKTGYIVGAVKSGVQKADNERFRYKEDTDDQWMPLNHAMVYLTDKKGRPLRAYCTDQDWNGVFVFDNLMPGEYRLRYEAYGYETKTETVKVVADKTTYLKPKLLPKQ
ncbi:MAG: carboxypeptidase regulatory-like domain-containing protein, partial [Muribaculaceae bacterium]